MIPSLIQIPQFKQTVSKRERIFVVIRLIKNVLLVRAVIDGDVLDFGHPVF